MNVLDPNNAHGRYFVLIANFCSSLAKGVLQKAGVLRGNII